MMKKTLIIILAVAALVSCNKGILGKTNGENTTSAPELVFNLSANYPDGAAITEVKAGWEKGDVFFVFFPVRLRPNT